jgi:transposase InsO family protein
VTRLCALYGVTPAGFYAWRQRGESAHAEQDRKLTQQITKIFRAHRGRYGSPRIWEELQAAGWRVSRRRVERLMRTAGLRARVVRVYRANPALHRFFGQHPNRLPRQAARRPDQIWVGDITYVPVGRRWQFLAVVLDQCSRRVLAWRLGRRRDARLTCRVLAAAVRRRQPPAGLIFHSDRGSEYVATAFRDRVLGWGLRQSSTQRGPGENAHMESFFHSLKAEAIHGERFTTDRAVRQVIAQYIRYYNRSRRHSALGYRSPIDFEAQAA